MFTKKKIILFCFLSLFLYPTSSLATVDYSLSFEDSFISSESLYDRNLKYALQQEIGGKWIVPKKENVWIDNSFSKSGKNSIGFKLAPNESRVELKVGDMDNNGIKYIGFSIFVPSDFEPPTHWNLFAQWWQGAPSSPPVAFEFVPNIKPLKFKILSRDGTSETFTIRTHYKNTIRTNAWTDFIVKMSIDDKGGESGILTVWQNGEIIVDYQGRLGYTDLYSHTNFRFGIYRSSANNSIAKAHFDEVKMGSSYNDVKVGSGAAPVAPTVSMTSKVTHHSTRVIGISRSAAKITVKSGTTTIGSATVDSKGKYKVAIKKQKVGTKLSIIATDATGNSSITILVTVVDGNYRDLKLTHWALDEIMYLADDQIIGGYPGGEFKPEKNTTRAEAAKMLALALELPIESAAAGYKDVSNKHWAKDYIVAVSKAGLFNGNPDGTFEPDDMLTRAEMAKVISIAYELEASSANPFKDVKKGHWAKGYISGLYENGITTGYSDNTFLPEKPTTRAEYSVFLARALNEDFR